MRNSLENDEHVDADRDDREAIDPLRLTITPAELEEEFRAKTAKDDITRMIGGAAVVCFPVLAFSYSDYVLFGMGPEFAVLLAGRVATLIAAVVAVQAVRKAQRASSRDAAVLFWWCMSALLATSVDATRPPTYMLHVAVDVLYVLTAYVLPSRWLHQLAAASVATIGPLVVVFLVKSPLTAMQIALVLVAFTYANVLGGFIAYRMHVGARSEFLLRARDQRSRSTLRAITRLVPMCAGCKSIRDGAGEWHRAEDYVREETGQGVSHGLCPPCVRNLYPDLAEQILAGGSDGPDVKGDHASPA